MPGDSESFTPERAYAPWEIKPAFDFGRVMSRTFSGLFRNIVPVLIAGLLISLLSGVTLLATSMITDTGPDDTYLSGVVGLMTTLYLIFLGCLYYGFCMDVAYRTLIGYPVGLKDSMWRALPHAFPLMVIAFLFWTGFFLGYLALLVPALILTAGWAIPGPAYMFGGAPILGSFGESWRLTRGYKWWVWLINFVVGLIAQIGAISLFILIFMVLALFQQTDLTTDPEAELSQAEAAFTFTATLLCFNLLAGLYASMKAAIYSECVDLQDMWERNRVGLSNAENDDPPVVI
ncbi:hypothetical protein ACFFUB_06150 [Algimonas porphyrae]|uniref:Uncharacterized protein n=1 Tax=Algimonas porphyrae TaxID=1128113 RepID=A0ABQ5V135_9PROT|nr:hypothetical protein [Algimonas porphyrae]GLQ21259.1 hypothetical protein GCM10007854_22140 [Algimonas porphyrae]